MAAVRRLEGWAAPLIRRAHLPRSPGAPLAQIVIGVLGVAFTGGLLGEELSSVRPIAVAATVLCAAITIPALGMILDGAWGLARKPMRHFHPVWYARLMHA